MNIYGLLKIIIYPIIVAMAYLLCKQDEFCFNQGIIKKRIKGISIFLISLAIAVYSMSFNKVFWWSDVSYYDYIFTTNQKMDQSIGLNIIFKILRNFTTNTDALLFVMGFLATSIMLLAYRELSESHSITILLMFLTLFFVETVQVNLKQSLACCFSYFCLLYFMRKKYVLTVFYLGLASIFHITAFPILLLTCVVMLTMKSKNEVFKAMVVVILCLAVVFNKYIFILLEKMTESIPLLHNKLLEYDPRFATETIASRMIVFKGIAYYLITLLAILYRKSLKDKIKNYDQMLIVSLVASLSYLLSGTIYWMSRVVCYFWLIDINYLVTISKRIKNKQERAFILWFIGILFAFITFRFMFQIYI